MPALIPRLLVPLCVCCAGLGVLPHAAAQNQIYHWTESNGEVIFSDQPPTSGQSAKQLQMPAPPSAADVEATQQRSDALKQQADAMASERQQRERLAAEAAQQTAPPAATEESSAPPHDDYHYPYYTTPPAGIGRPSIVRPGDRPLRPTQPIARPGLGR
jgi:hypothetical protein